MNTSSLMLHAGARSNSINFSTEERQLSLRQARSRTGRVSIVFTRTRSCNTRMNGTKSEIVRARASFGPLVPDLP